MRVGVDYHWSPVSGFERVVRKGETSWIAAGLQRFMVQGVGLTFAWPLPEIRSESGVGCSDMCLCL
jgi:hypothetical protein